MNGIAAGIRRVAACAIGIDLGCGGAEGKNVIRWVRGYSDAAAPG